MATAVYATDLATFDLAEAATAWAEPTASGWTLGAAPGTADTENVIQGTYSIPKAFNATGVGGMLANFGSGPTIPTDGGIFYWFFWASPATLDSEANGGIRAVVGSALNAIKAWKVGGKDTYTYGGWVNIAVDPTISYDYVSGSPTNYQYAGICVNNLNAITKGSPFVHDAIRYGRGELRVNGGDLANGYATFVGMAAKNDANDAGAGYNRWGLFQATLGVYLWKGLLTLGYTSAVDFRDANRAILIENTKKVGANFNKIEIRQASSRVDWTSISITALGTVSKGRLEVVDDCDVNFSSCVFTDMDTFIFKATSDVLACVFRRCNTITANDAKFAGTLFDAASVAADTSQLIWDVNTDPNTDLNGCTFVKGANAHHAIEFGTTSPTSMTLTNVTLTGFNAANAANDSAIHFKRTTGTVTLTITGGTSPSYKTAGATIVIVTSSRTIKAIAQKADGTKIQSARVFLKTAATASGGFPYNATVTITNSGTTATVSHTAHGMLTNDKVVISGASLPANNGVWTITKTTDDAYTYTMGSSPGSNPTGTIKCSFVFLEGETDGSGELSMSRAIGANQTVIGWVRKSSAAPYYKEGPLGGTVSSGGDSTFTAVLSPDE
jgi:hypothetical protein